MKKGIILLCLPLVVGCLKTRSEISDTQDKKEAQTQITAIQQEKAENTSRMQDYEASLRQLNGRLEAIEYRMNLDLEKRQKEEAGSPQTQQVQKQLVDQMKIFEESLARVEARLAQMESDRTVKAVPAPQATPKVVKDGDAPAYMEAEAFLQKKDWGNAILAYQKYRDENPKGKKFADATYKIGACFQEMGKNAEAKVFFDEVLEKFPKSESARKAAYRLKNLK